MGTLWSSCRLVETPSEAGGQGFVRRDGLPDLVCGLTGCQSRLKICFQVADHELETITKETQFIEMARGRTIVPPKK